MRESCKGRFVPVVECHRSYLGVENWEKSQNCPPSGEVIEGSYFFNPITHITCNPIFISHSVRYAVTAPMKTVLGAAVPCPLICIHENNCANWKSFTLNDKLTLLEFRNKVTSTRLGTLALLREGGSCRAAHRDAASRRSVPIVHHPNDASRRHTFDGSLL